MAATSEGYATGRATKQAIVEHAAQAFADKGYYGTSLRGIARDAGIDHSLLLHHFKNKTALLLAVIDWYDGQHDVASLEAAYEGGVSTLAEVDELLMSGLAEAARINASRPGLVRLFSVLTAEAGAPDHPARAALRERHERLVEVYSLVIQVRDMFAASEGLSVSELPAEQRAVLFISAWEGLQVYDSLHPGEIDLPTMLGEAMQRIA